MLFRSVLNRLLQEWGVRWVSLKKTIQDLLNRHPHLARFYPAPPQEGDAGATIAELRA